MASRVSKSKKWMFSFETAISAVCPGRTVERGLNRPTAFDELSGTRRRAMQRQVDRVDDLRHRRTGIESPAPSLVEVDDAGRIRPLRLDAG